MGQSTTTRKVVSAVARKALAPERAARARHGVPVLPRRPKGAPRPTMTLVNDLRD